MSCFGCFVLVFVTILCLFCGQKNVTSIFLIHLRTRLGLLSMKQKGFLCSYNISNHKHHAFAEDHNMYYRICYDYEDPFVREDLCGGSSINATDAKAPTLLFFLNHPK